MSSVRWVLDTNVIVSGLLSAHGPPGRLVDAVVSGDLCLVYDDRIEAEYREVLARPRLRIPAQARDAFLDLLRLQDHVTAEPWRSAPPPDVDDQMFLEAAVLADDRVLVTGNVRHFPRRSRGPIAVSTPRQAWERLVRRRPTS